MPSITADIVELALVRKVGSNLQFDLSYGLPSSAYRVKAILDKANQVTITEFNQIYSNLETPRLQYGSLENVRPIALQEAQSTKTFKVAQSKLFNDYGHFLRNPVVKEVLVDNSVQGVSTFNIVYDTSNGVFLGIVDVNEAATDARIRALVLLDSSGLQKRAADCSEFASPSGDKCKQCNAGFLLRNGSCYPVVEQCVAQIGTACLLCSTPYEVKDNVCSQGCGPFQCAKA